MIADSKAISINVDREKISLAATILFLNLLLLYGFLNAEVLIYNNGTTEWWTFFTSHFTHWDVKHYSLNVICFNVLFMGLYLQNKKLPWLLLISVPCLLSGSFELLINHPFQYCGLSGLVTALTCALGTQLICQKNTQVLGLVILSFIVLKMSAESLFMITPMSSFSSFSVLHEAHYLGAFFGVLVTLIARNSQ